VTTQTRPARLSHPIFSADDPATVWPVMGLSIARLRDYFVADQISSIANH
jgi:hypothetical protein